MSMILTTKQVFPPLPAQQSMPVPFVKPLTYEFRVVETVEDGKVVSVKLQMQTFEHDEFGIGSPLLYWQDVPRVRMDKNGVILPP